MLSGFPYGFKFGVPKREREREIQKKKTERGEREGTREREASHLPARRWAASCRAEQARQRQLQKGFWEGTKEQQLQFQRGSKNIGV